MPEWTRQQKLPGGSKVTVAGEDHGALFVAGVHELEDEVGTAGGDREIADLINDQERGATAEADFLDQAALTFGPAERFDQLGE